MIIGLNGLARSGKDTAAEYIAWRYGFERYAFADPIRNMLRVGFGLTDWDFNEGKEDPLEEWGVSPRYMMQTLGTDWGRERLRSDCWLKVAQRNVRDNTIISDVRFNNEAQWIQDTGGLVIRITRDNAPTVAAHVSENGISETLIAYEIYNIGTKQELYDNLDEILSEWGLVVLQLEPVRERST